MKDLQCDESTLAGPVDDQVVSWLEKNYCLDPDYLATVEAFHGGEPKVGTFEIASGQYQIGMFLTLLDDDSDLPPPHRPHFGLPDTDERVVNSIAYLVDGEHATSGALFGRLTPFAAMQTDMMLDRAYVDLLCFDGRSKRERPPVVLWISDRALEALLEWEELPMEKQFDDDEAVDVNSVPWDDFLEPVADDFRSFVEMLRAN